jgi:hypothetical protein
MLGISLLQYVHRQAKALGVIFRWSKSLKSCNGYGSSFCSTHGKARRVSLALAYVLSKQTLAQQALAKALKLDQLQITHRGNTKPTL